MPVKKSPETSELIEELQTAPVVVEPDTLFSALVAAQLEFTPIIKDKLNPHFKSKYADLD